MAHMQFDAKLKEAMKLEGELSKGPKCQKKPTDQSFNRSVNENSFLVNKSLDNMCVRTQLDGERSGPSTSSGRGKSPGRVLTKLSVRSSGISDKKTPTRKTPNKIGDRFIPNRSATDFERSHQLITQNTENESNGADDKESLKQKEYREKMLENLNDGATPCDRVMSFSAKAPDSNNKYSSTKVLFSTTKASSKKASTNRHIPSEPEKVLDAPELLNDYYLHLMDWSANNHLAVALGQMVFLWNGTDGSISPLTQYDAPDYVSSLSWVKEGHLLAVGLSSSSTQLWDVSQTRLLRTMGGHSDRVSTLSWNNHILTSGSRSGKIIHHDVRVPDHVSATLDIHTQEVCGLKWSPDGNLLASGGNDNLVNIWDNRSSSVLHAFNEHQAAVKALAWCPWQSNFLASGGGTIDRTIKLWNCSLGTSINSVDTDSQVSSIVWSTHYRELISGHGYSRNQLTLWKYPSFERIVDLTGHGARVLELCLSPDGQTVVSAAADETLRLWKCWAVDKQKKTKAPSSTHAISALTKTIR